MIIVKLTNHCLKHVPKEHNVFCCCWHCNVLIVFSIPELALSSVMAATLMLIRSATFLTLSGMAAETRDSNYSMKESIGWVIRLVEAINRACTLTIKWQF